MPNLSLPCVFLAACLVFSFYASTATSHALLHYPLSEGGGRILHDLSANKLTGVCSTPSQWLSKSSLGGTWSLKFSREQRTFAKAPSSPLLDSLVGSFTVSVLVKPNSSWLEAESGAIVSKRSRTSLRGFELVYNPGLGLILLSGTGSSRVSSYPLRLDSNNWSHVVGVWKGIQGRIYVNGVEVTDPSSGSLQPVRSTLKALTIAKSTIGGMYYSGLLSDFQLHATALSEKEIQELYETYFPSASPSALASVSATPSASTSASVSTTVSASTSVSPLASALASIRPISKERGAWMYPRPNENFTLILDYAVSLRLDYVIVSYRSGTYSDTVLNSIAERLSEVGTEVRLMTLENPRSALSTSKDFSVSVAVEAASRCLGIGCKEIHLDIEEYALPEWKSGDELVKLNILRQLNETLFAIKSAVSSGVLLSKATSWWNENKYPEFHAGLPLDRLYKSIYGAPGLGEDTEDIVGRIRAQPNAHPTFVGIGRRQFVSTEEMLRVVNEVEEVLQEESYFLGTTLFNLNIMQNG